MDQELIKEAAEELVPAVVKTTRGMLVLASACSAVAGAVAGYLFAQKRLVAKYEEIASAEIAEAREAYEKKHKVEEFATPESAKKKLIGDTPATSMPTVPVDVAKQLKYYQGDGSAVVGSQPRIEINADKVVIQSDPDLDGGLHRDPTVPYFIEPDEFNEGNPHFQQVTLTYYAGDDTLADENEQMMDDRDATVGTQNLHRFGDISEGHDPNVIHVRNERLGIDYEIVRSMNEYGKEIGGFGELQHSFEPMRRKPRLDDD